MLFAPFVSQEGERRLRAGLPVERGHIVEEELRALAPSAEEELVRDVRKMVQRRIDVCTADIGKAQAKADRHGIGGRDLEAGRAASPEVARLEALRGSLQADEAALGRYEVATLDPAGSAAKLLHSATQPLDPMVLFEKIALLYNKPGEVAQQTAQRFGQAFYFLVLGSAVASIAGRASSAASRGAENETVLQIMLVAVAAATLAFIGAYSQGLSTVVKNNRRALANGNGAFGADLQVGRTMVSGALVHSASRQADRSRAELSQSIASLREAFQFDESLSRVLPEAADPA